MKILLILFFYFSVIESRGPPVAPYIDMILKTGTLTQIAKDTGLKAFTLAFVLGGITGGCDPHWGGTIPLNDTGIINEIKEFKAVGGDVIIATGGAAGPYLETGCRSVSELTGAYRKILDTLGAQHLDIDVEATVPLDTMNQALAAIQKERPSTTVSFTLMVQGDDYGLTPQLGVDVLKNAAKNGLNVDIVNPMTMEFGTKLPSWGDAVIAAAESTLKQMKEIWPQKSDAQLKSMLGVTPMIGRNFNGKIFDISHAHQLVKWAKANSIGLLAFWSVGRDNGGCAGGGISPNCSSIAQGKYEFCKIFDEFRGHIPETTQTPDHSHTDANTKVTDAHTKVTDSPTKVTDTPHQTKPTVPAHTEFKCTESGYFVDPNDKHIYHQCVSNGNGGFTHYTFRCGPGTVFDQTLQTCVRE